MTEGLFETFPLSLCVPIFCGVTHRRFVAFLPKAEIIVASVAVPEKIIGLTLFLDFFDRCLSLTSLHLPPAALGSLPVFELVAPSLHRRLGFGFRISGDNYL